MIPLLQLPLDGLWASTVGFIVLAVAGVGAIGLAGRNLAVASMGAYLTFAFYASTVDVAFLEEILYVTLALVIIGSAFKLWRLEGFETGS